MHVHAGNLRSIRLSEDRVILKRGVHELLLEGPGIAGLAERLLLLADGTREKTEMVEAFPGPQRAAVGQMLEELARRRMVGPEPEETDRAVDDPDQAAFYWNFGPRGDQVLDDLATARVLVVGANGISRALVRGLFEMGVRSVTVAGHAVLDHRPTAAVALPECWDECRHLTRMPSDRELAECSLICATCDLGEADALLDVNRDAIAAGRPFLAAWFADLLGFVGPLHVPFETPCFRCFRLRRDANDPRFEVGRAVRHQLTAEPSKGPGLLPPMASILGGVAALEIVKHLGGFAPADSVGHLIELNLVSFRSVVRRLLKVPRCPECSGLAVHSQKAITNGPQLPAGDWMEAR